MAVSSLEVLLVLSFFLFFSLSLFLSPSLPNILLVFSFLFFLLLKRHLASPSGHANARRLFCDENNGMRVGKVASIGEGHVFVELSSFLTQTTRSSRDPPCLFLLPLLLLPLRLSPGLHSSFSMTTTMTMHQSQRSSMKNPSLPPPLRRCRMIVNKGSRACAFPSRFSFAPFTLPPFLHLVKLFFSHFSLPFTLLAVLKRSLREFDSQQQRVAPCIFSFFSSSFFFLLSSFFHMHFLLFLNNSFLVFLHFKSSPIIFKSQEKKVIWGLARLEQGPLLF